MKILVTNVSYHCSVGVIKLLRKIKKYFIEIIGCSSYPLGLSSGSLMVDRFYQSPTKEEGDNYLNFILRLLKSENIDFMITTDENELILFDTHREMLCGKTVIPSVETLRLFQHKQKASETIKNLGISVPSILSYPMLLDNIPNQKIILRENISCCSYGIHVCDSMDTAKIKKYHTETCFIQEYISGQEYTVDVFCDRNGNPQIIIPRERLEIRNGITYKCRISKNLDLIEICQKIYAHYFLPGFSNVQFIVENKTPYFIELNTRMGGTTIASSLASINLVELLINHFFYNQDLLGFEYYMKFVKWGAIITRYYEETMYLGVGE